MHILRQSVFARLGLILLAIGFFLFTLVGHAYANPSQFVPTTQTALATTSITYVLPGVATTTLVADTYTTATGNTYINNATELLLQFTASSTLSRLNVNLEYSNGWNGGDCVNNQSSCDWYQDSISNVFSFATSSLPLIALSQVPQYQWAFASSTLGQQIPSATNNRDSRAMKILVPTRYVRAVFTCSGAGCGVWAQFVPIKEGK